MNDRELSRKMRDLAGECLGLEPAEELALLDDRLRQEGDAAFVLEMKIIKAQRLFDLGRVDASIQLIDECSRSPDGDESAAYFAAEILVQSHRYQEAEGFLERAERVIAETGREYYKECIYLLHAYCAAKAGDVSRAGSLLEMVADKDAVLFWLRTSPVIAVKTVQDLIAGGEPERGC